MHAPSMHYVYILESSKVTTWYTGYTTDLDQRLKANNEGKNASTAQKGPWKLIYFVPIFLVNKG